MSCAPNKGLTLRETVLFGLLGALMFASKLLMDALPNIHLIALLIAAVTVVFRLKALFPIYVFVFLTGLTSGFDVWWLPYLYIWTILWGAFMLLPQRMPEKIKPFIYAAVCALHGLLYGVLYAPMQALIFGLDFKQTLAWIAAGFPFDAVHALSNLIAGSLVVPLAKALTAAAGKKH